MKKTDKEQRLVEMRAVDNTDNKMLIEGYAIMFEQPATHEFENRKFTETIKRSALLGTDMKDVPLRYNHNDNVMVMARTRNNSLQLIQDETGLKIMADLIDTQSNRDLYKSIQAGLIDKMSFAFTISENGDAWIITDDETTREVNKIEKLWDVSVVDSPFYDSTSIYARSLELLDNEERRLDSLNELQVLKIKLKMKVGL